MLVLDLFDLGFIVIGKRIKSRKSFVYKVLEVWNLRLDIHCIAHIKFLKTWIFREQEIHSRSMKRQKFTVLFHVSRLGHILWLEICPVAFSFIISSTHKMTCHITQRIKQQHNDIKDNFL